MSVVNECSKGKNIKKQFNRVDEKEEKNTERSCNGKQSTRD